MSTRIDVLAELVVRVSSMLADGQHAINCQAAFIKAERLLNARTYPYAMPSCERNTHVFVTDLVHVERNDLHLWIKQAIVCWKSADELANDYVSICTPAQTRGTRR